MPEALSAFENLKNIFCPGCGTEPKISLYGVVTSKVVLFVVVNFINFNLLPGLFIVGINGIVKNKIINSKSALSSLSAVIEITVPLEDTDKSIGKMSHLVNCGVFKISISYSNL